MQKEIEMLRHKFREDRAELFRHVSWNSSCRDLLVAHSSLVDTILKEIYEISCRAADRKAPRCARSGLAIVATGGYGRRELNPYSDIDIAFVPSEEADPWVEALVHTAFRYVMDVFLSLRDMRVGYAFRPIAEASAWDINTKTALLDLRHICGDSDLAIRLGLRIREVLSPLDLMHESRSAGDRTQKSPRSLYSVEPNLKEGPGSLRDLHRARWILELLLGADNQELDRALKGWGGISEQQIAKVRAAADWFWRARTWLHLAAGRLSDVLITNYQDRIARELNGCSAQEWLSQHLAHSETLARFRETSVRALLQGPLTVSGIVLENGSLHLPVDSRACKTGMFLVSQRYSIPISLNDVKRLGETRDSALEAKVPSIEEIWAFKEILAEGHGMAVTLRALLEFGILDRFIPRYSEVMRFVPPDPAHCHTVGEHSLRMVEHLENLRAGLDPQGQRFTELLDQCQHFDMLCLAALLHDAGKLVSGDDHCSTSADIAMSVSARLNLAPEKREILDVLVRQHLLLVRTARLHDLKSVHVVRKAIEQVPNLDSLRHLYVFTYVDTCAVAEKNWTSTDHRDLEDLHRKMQDHFTRRSEKPSSRKTREERSILIREKLAALQAKNETAVLKHCDAMPASYVLNTPLEEIAFHLQLLERLESERVVLDVYNRPGDDYSELTICTLDDPKPGMLAKITGVLYGCNADIQKAQAFTIEKENRVVLDTLWIRSNGLQISENKARKILSTLKDVLTGTNTIEHFLELAGKSPPPGILLDAIDLHNDLSEEHTVVHIVAHDLQGLLYLMTRSLSQCGLNIHSAKIATWNARAENNFYVTSMKGGQIPDIELQIWTERLAGVLQGNGIET
ncbi:MAG: UTP--GlnB [Acidobacteria bacterium]|nr:UTP--GlnB [Acidobacteriota bacterium]